MMGDKGSIDRNEIGEDFEQPFDRVYPQATVETPKLRVV